MLQAASAQKADFIPERCAWPAGRVALIAPEAPPYGGMALQAALLARLLRADGHEVSFCAVNFPLPRMLRALEKLPGIRTAVRALWIWPRFWRQFAGVEAVHVLAASWLYFFVVVYPAVVVARLRGKRLVLNYRGGGAEEFFQRLGWLAKPVFRLADAVTTPSEFLRETIQRHFSIAVSIVPNILDLKRFQYRERPAVRPCLLVNRHLEKIYDIESVLRAFGLVQERYPEASLCIAGSGVEEQKLRQLAAELQLRNVRFLGHVPQRELPAVYDACDVLVNASRIDNFPGALVEASASGLVVVSTEAGGIPAIYRHEESALLVPVGDWKALAREVERAIETPGLAARLAKAALGTVRMCGWDEVRERLYAIYRLGEPARQGERV